MKGDTRIRLLLTLLFLGLGINSSQSETIDISDKELTLNSTYISNEIDGGFYYNQLNKIEKVNYDRILSGCQNFETRVPISDISLNSFYKVQTAFNYDNPQFFWTLSYTISITSQTKTPVYVNYEISEEDKKIYDMLDKLGGKIIGDMPEGYNSYQKIKYLYEYIVDSTEYALAAEYNQDIRSVLLNKSSICAGYARTFQFLCCKAGIPCTFIAGEANGGRHAWNLVYLNGSYYWIDPTWGETIYADGTVSDTIRYDYFLVSDKSLFKSHILTGDVETTRNHIEGAFTYPKCHEDFGVGILHKLLISWDPSLF